MAREPEPSIFLKGISSLFKEVRRNIVVIGAGKGNFRTIIGNQPAPKDTLNDWSA